MSSINFNKIQFVNGFQPGGSAATGKLQQHIISSHRARTAHARARLRRTRDYHAAKARQLRLPVQKEGATENDQGGEDVTSTSSMEPDAAISDAELLGVLSSSTSPLLVNRLDAHETFPAPVKPFEYPLFHHYVKMVIPASITHCKKLSKQRSYAERMCTEWVRLALMNEGFLSGILLVASRHLSMIYHYNQIKSRELTQLALQYKVTCVGSLNLSITANHSSKFSDSTIAQVIVLTLDEIALGDLLMARNHMRGAIRMVELNGGPATLGLDGFLELVFHDFVSELGMLPGLPDQAPSAPCGGAFHGL
ncbi:hypothetical protein L228DRAFT_285733 [Xylona heveae TC161]|uniref:Uncharacterized protein n=1 Tax=Xylona heveae (strain CBS 132557 / TC161) TaxID=1328760 RepID=A0A165A0Y2_XYLHT|nr:hypothetical protein L228DRAFT_285733 [Xylona heveae TC161]KZF19799.1 hypothetical protein L228DRAFT_285733 [Xylona heveae TC161]